MLTRGIRLLLVLCWFPLTVFGGEQLTYDRVGLSASASTKVANDTLVVVLYRQEQGKSLAQLAERLNRIVAWGVVKVKHYPGVEIQTPGYHTSPVYQNGSPTGLWRIRQSIRLESRDFKRIGALLGELQEKLAIQQLGYRLSAERRREVENGLIETAIARFRQKAKLIAGQFGAYDFRLVSLDVSAVSGERPMPVMRAMAMEAKSAAIPVVEEGEQEVRIDVNGIIELMRQ